MNTTEVRIKTIVHYGVLRHYNKYQHLTATQSSHTLHNVWADSWQGHKMSRLALVSTCLPFSQLTQALYPGGKMDRAAKLTTHIHQVPKFTMNAALPELPVQAFMVQTGLINYLQFGPEDRTVCQYTHTHTHHNTRYHNQEDIQNILLLTANNYQSNFHHI